MQNTAADRGPRPDHGAPSGCAHRPSFAAGLQNAIASARDRLLALQSSAGYWVFDVEADSTIPAEYILLQRFLDRPIPSDLQSRLARYLRRRQLPDGGWPLFTGGRSDISAAVKAYFALKTIGDDPGLPHMVRARGHILHRGGAAKANVFTRITLALFGQIPWRAAPVMPVEILLLPPWFLFHLNKVSYWSRAVIVPLLILYARQPVCRLRSAEGVAELFAAPVGPRTHLDRCLPGQWLKNLFVLLDRGLKRLDGRWPRALREKALRRAERWTLDHMQGEGGIGAIFPAMANAVMALRLLGYTDDHPAMRRGLRAIDDLLVSRGDEAFCQPCVSPVWDTCLSLSALLTAELSAGNGAVRRAMQWLQTQQVLVPGDWSARAARLTPGGWAFQFENRFYPDIDDTAMVLMALLRAGGLQNETCRRQMAKGVNWIIGMQNADGGWGAFDVDNNHLYLNNIPFADHGALLDPSTADLTARCVELLAMVGYGRDFPPLARGVAFLRLTQEPRGAWFGRWGVNYLYGTWSVLAGLRQAGEDMRQAYVRRAVAWLQGCQNTDGGWGETCESYQTSALAGKGPSTASQTAWALMGLLAAGEVNSRAVRQGLEYLITTQNPQGGWDETAFTGTGFPRVFYLRYHGYPQYFPLWALGLYQRFSNGAAFARNPR
jgi:squalene-hopene/tetraprenyl-beta-curcumene cyclase